MGMQGLVMCGWPHSVLMPGQPRKKDAKTKGIADLTLGDWCRLHAALIDKEISVGKPIARLNAVHGLIHADDIG